MAYYMGRLFVTRYVMEKETERMRGRVAEGGAMMVGKVDR